MDEQLPKTMTQNSAGMKNAKEAIVDLLGQEKISLHHDYEDELFLMDYDVYVDKDGNPHPIEWNDMVSVTEEWHNDLGDVVKTNTFKTSLEDVVVNTLGISHDEDFMLHNNFFKPLFSSGGVQEEKDHHIDDDLEDFYQDPEGYLEQNDLKDLPPVTLQVIEINLRN